MRELHVVALSEDGRHVVLATTPDAASGEFRVALDQRLTSAVRGELPRPDGETAPTISPREIQARLRDGESPEQIATAAGVPLSRVERFAGPVLAELDRVLAGARAATVHRPRLGPSDVPLGEAVELSLADVSGFVPESVRWSARREDAGRWVVQLSWSARGRRRTAGWRYDPSRAELTPVDTTSANLGHVEDAAAARAAVAAAAAAAAAVTDTAAGPGRRRAVRPAPGGAARKSAQEQSPAAARRTSSRAAARAAPATEAATAAPTTKAQRGRAGAASPDAGHATARAASPRTTRAAVPRATPATSTTTRKPAPQPATTATAKPPVRRRAAVPPVVPEERTSTRAATAAGASRDVPSQDVASQDADDRDRLTPGREPAADPVPARPPLLRVVPADPEPHREPRGDGRPRKEAARDRPGRDERARGDGRPAAGRARAGGHGSGAPDWADVLMGAAPGPPRDDRPGE